MEFKKMKKELTLKDIQKAIKIKNNYSDCNCKFFKEHQELTGSCFIHGIIFVGNSDKEKIKQMCEAIK